MIMPCMNSTSACERGGSVALVDGGSVLLGLPGAPGCTTTGVAGSVCCGRALEQKKSVGALGVKKLSSATALIQKQPRRLPHGKYVLHRARRSQENDQLLREGPQRRHLRRSRDSRHMTRPGHVDEDASAARTTAGASWWRCCRAERNCSNRWRGIASANCARAVRHW